MKNKNRLLSITLTILFAVLGSTITLRSIAIFKYLDKNSGYYQENILNTISNLVLVCSVFIFVLYIFFGKKGKLKADFNNPTIMVTSGVCAISTVIFAAKMFGYFASDYRFLNPDESILQKPVMIITLLCGIFGVLSCVHFFLNMFTTHRVAVLRSYMAMGSVIFLALYATYLYFNTTLALNSPNKITDQLAFLLTAVFFLYETRISLGTDKWRMYVATGLIASALIGYSCIPSLIVYFVRGDVISISIEESVFMLTMLVYIISRLLLCTSLPQDVESPIIASFSKFASEQSQKIAENDRFYREKYAVQLTIDDLIEPAESSEGGEEEEKSEEESEPIAEEYIQDSFFNDDFTAPEINQTAIPEIPQREEVNYEENPDN